MSAFPFPTLLVLVLFLVALESKKFFASAKEETSPSETTLSSFQDPTIQQDEYKPSQHLRSHKKLSSPQEEEENQDELPPQQQEARETTRNLAGEFRIAVKYNGIRGRRVVRSCAKEILRESNGLVLIQAGGACMDQLMRSMYIDEVDFDYAVSAIRDEEAMDYSDDPTTRRRRTTRGNIQEQPQEETDELTLNSSYSSSSQPITNRNLPSERIPWGIEMIQADQLEVPSEDETVVDNDEIPANGFGRIRGNAAATRNRKMTVCLADTGVAIDHPDLDNARFTGDNLVGMRRNVLRWDVDKDGHGTHLAGTMAAIKGNAIGVAGAGGAVDIPEGESTASQSYDFFKVHVTRALDDQGQGWEWDVRAAVDQCVQAGAKIINLSLGSTQMSRSSERFYRRIVDDLGIMIIAASGNDGVNTPLMYPASHASVISVSSVDEDEDLSGHSNFGSQIEFAGPGLYIYSTGLILDTIETSDGTVYPSFYALDTTQEAATRVTGELVDCQDGQSTCSSAQNGGICFMIQDNSDLKDMVDNCIRGGGAGAIIFKEDGDVEQLETPPSIPVMIGKDSNKNDIGDSIGSVVTIGRGNPYYTYSWNSGTSMAAAHVTAAAAIVWDQNPTCTNHQIRYALAYTATKSQKCGTSFGYGVPQVQDCLDWLEDNPCEDWDVPHPITGGCGTL